MNATCHAIVNKENTALDTETTSALQQDMRDIAKIGKNLKNHSTFFFQFVKRIFYKVNQKLSLCERLNNSKTTKIC